MEVIPKRYRSGSISSRLRSASELLDEGVLENRQQKGLLKDLIISGDETLADALSRYERGDKEPIKNLLREGVLNRKSSLDLLGDVGDLSFDFLSVSANPTTHGLRNNLDAPFPMDDEEMTFEILLQESTDTFGKSPPKKFFSHNSFTLGRAQMGQRSSSLSSIPGASSLGTYRQGALQNKSNTPSQQQFSSLGTPPPDLFEFSILDETGVGAWAHPALRGGSFNSRTQREVLDFASDEELESPPTSPQQMPMSTPSAFPPPVPRSGAASSSTPRQQRKASTKASAAAKETGSASATSAPIVIPRASKANSASASSSRSASAAASTSKRSGERGASAAAASERANASAAPPLSQMTQEERAASRRAQGVPMIGAYSPESRRVRVERFVAKRDRRVWKKKVKYDVRKNFADSRLRVKGRFVKKEDEEMLRDLMTMV
jgi:hypothetical protein